MSVIDELFDSPIAVDFYDKVNTPPKFKPYRIILKKSYHTLLKAMLSPILTEDLIQDVIQKIGILNPPLSEHFLTKKTFGEFISKFHSKEQTNIYRRLRAFVDRITVVPELTVPEPPVTNPLRRLLRTAVDYITPVPTNPFQQLPYYGGFEIILLISMHGGTSVTCSNRNVMVNQVDIPSPMEVTLMEGSPCGVCYYEPPYRAGSVRNLVSYYKDIVDRNSTPLLPVPFLDAIQIGLRRSRDANIQKSTDVGLANVDVGRASEYRGWNILKGTRILEREYTTDNVLCNLVVLHSTKGPFQTNQNLLDTHPIKSRSQLISLLEESGYTKVLILDPSCAMFEDASLDFEPSHVTRQRTFELTKEGLAGGVTRRKRKRRSFRQYMNRKYTRYE